MCESQNKTQVNYLAEIPASSNALATCFTTPESNPEVNTQAPVVSAAFKRPSRKTLPNFSGTL